MRTRCLVAYDISDDRRLRQVFKIMNGFGDAIQYSVFVCDLSEVERWKLKDRLVDVIHHREDRVVFVNLGPSGARGVDSFEYLGRQVAVPGERAATIV